jgi:divalent metal cation (Fe/Co/Zn/Cd) transporter
VTTSVIAHRYKHLWYIDSIGAILISVYIAASWLATGKEQVERLVGLREYIMKRVFLFCLFGVAHSFFYITEADDEFIEEVTRMVEYHHPLMKSDIVRAYHFGNNFLVEAEVILPEEMTVRDAHDISLALQKNIEALNNVERAFVHVDYLSRDYDEHKDPTIRLNLV